MSCETTVRSGVLWAILTGAVLRYWPHTKWLKNRIFSCEIVCSALKKTWPANLQFRHCVCTARTDNRYVGTRFFVIWDFTLRFKTYTSLDYKNHSIWLACQLLLVSGAFLIIFMSASFRTATWPPKKPAQYNIIERTEIIEAKESKLCFWITMISAKLIRNSTTLVK